MHYKGTDFKMQKNLAAAMYFVGPPRRISPTSAVNRRIKKIASLKMLSLQKPVSLK